MKFGCCDDMEIGVGLLVEYFFLFLNRQNADRVDHDFQQGHRRVCVDRQVLETDPEELGEKVYGRRSDRHNLLKKQYHHRHAV